MSKYNRPGTRTAVHSPITTTSSEPTTRTHEGAPAYTRDTKSELFLLAVSNFGGENTFYESARDRDSRFASLVHTAALADPDWCVRFLTWLRTSANMRTASLIGAAEFVHARLAATAARDLAPDDQAAAREGGGWNRRAINAVLQRADEPGELLAYWTSRFGRDVPKPVKRGIADAVQRLYNERSLLKYDTASHGFRFADVLAMTHPNPRAPWQGSLFRHAIDRRYGRGADTHGLPMLTANNALRAAAADDPTVLLDARRLRDAGMTWEDALSLAGPGIDKAKLWTALIPTMGYMALARNLRNLDEAGVDDQVAATIAERLANPDQVAASRQLPFRYLSAYTAAPSLRWGHALERALAASLTNIPALPGRTLILADTSGSMLNTLSERSTVSYAKAAAVFGVALAAKGAADLYGFANHAFAHPVQRGASVLREIDRFCDRIGEAGHGTNIAGAIGQTYTGHTRIVIISDLQTRDYIQPESLPGIPIYAFNLAGYRQTPLPTGQGPFHELGGLTDATFKMLPLLEAGRNATWPF